MLKEFLNKLRGQTHEKGILFNSITIANAADDGWIKIVPIGTFPMHPQGGHEITYKHVVEMAENFTNGGTDLLFDYEHKSMWGESIAAGWSYQVDAREDGLYAKYPEFTSNASQMVEFKEYRYFSPAYKLETTDKQGKGIGAVLDHVALTNKPYMDNEVDAIGNAAIPSSNESDLNPKTTDMKLNKESLSILGLPEDATEEQVNEALANADITLQNGKSETTDDEPTKSETPNGKSNADDDEPAAINDELAARLNSVENKLDEKEKQEKNQRAETLVNSAVDQGKINPADKDAYLNAAKADFDGTKKVLDERKANSAMPGKVSVDENADTSGGTKKNSTQECADYIRGQMKIGQTG